MIRSAWVELQHLKDLHGKAIDILHYQPSDNENKIYTMQAQALRIDQKSANN